MHIHIDVSRHIPKTLMGYRLIFKGASINAHATIEESTQDVDPALILVKINDNNVQLQYKGHINRL